MKNVVIKTRLILILIAMMLPVLSLLAQVKVYKGTSSYTSDIEFTIAGDLTIEEFMAVWYAVKYCY